MKTSPLSAYQCYYCPFHRIFERVSNHSVDIHTDKPLKCRQLIHRKFKYQSEQFDVLPSELQPSRKYITCDSCNESIFIQTSSAFCIILFQYVLRSLVLIRVK